MEKKVPQAFVETISGDQMFFDSPYEAFRFAKQQEEQNRNSVEYVAISFTGESLEETNEIVYRGQRLRHILRSLDNVRDWIRAQLETELTNEDE